VALGRSPMIRMLLVVIVMAFVFSRGCARKWRGAI
jgi:hypothetical protein